MGYRQIYVLKRAYDLQGYPDKVYHSKAFGGMGFGHVEDPSFAKRFDIIAMDEKTMTVQEKDETV